MVIGQLQDLLDHDLTFMAAVLDCISNMQLPQHMQVRWARRNAAHDCTSPAGSQQTHSMLCMQ
jgi:hypothetical protein